jgi:hypothetical protein
MILYGDADVILLQHLFGAVTRAYHRSRDDLEETLLEALFAIGLELPRG